MVEILYTYEWKWTSDIETSLRMGGRGIKENDGGDEFNYDILQALL
jgi:hypothetical protein